jgi:hypothetical protein
MPKQIFSKTLIFIKCQNWNTETCPHLRAFHMQLSIKNQLNWFMLNDRSVGILAERCKASLEFRHG